MDPNLLATLLQQYNQSSTGLQPNQAPSVQSNVPMGISYYSPVATQIAQGQGAATVQGIQNQGQLGVQGLANQGQATNQGLINSGQLATQGLVNQGQLGTQGLVNQGNLAVTQQQGANTANIDAARWQRVMAFLQQTGLDKLFSGGSMGQLSGQVTSANAAPAIRNYETQKRDIANRIGARGMSLSTANDQAQGEAYGNLSRALAEAGTQGDIASMGLTYNLLGDLLRMGSGS